MPHMTGDRLSSEALKIRPDIPIILCTGYSEKISQERAEELGIRKYIEKPLTKEILANSVRRFWMVMRQDNSIIPECGNQ